MIRRLDPVHTVVWVSAGCLLVSGWIIGSALGLWNAQVEPGFTFCLDSDANCPVTIPSPDVAGEFVTFGLLVLGGIACCVAALLPLLRRKYTRQKV